MRGPATIGSDGAMADNGNTDYYEALQVSPNVDTGNDSRFRLVHEAYTILSDPESRAKYDVFHQQQRQNRWKIATSGVHADGDLELERLVRLTVLEMLYMKRRTDPRNPGIFS